MDTVFNNILGLLGHATTDQIKTAHHRALVSNTNCVMSRGRCA